MKNKKRYRPIWIAVKVERGFISDARLFNSPEAAERVEKRWRIRLNPDYDETAVVKARITPP